MMHFKVSFLFFYIAITFSCLSHSYVSAQNVIDSTAHHFQNLKAIKNTHDVSKALNFFKSTSDFFLTNNDSISAAKHLEILSYGHFKMGHLYDSESTTIRAYSILDHIKDSLTTLAPKKRLLNQLGMIYKQKQDYDNALSYYKKALLLTTSIENRISIINNISNIYAEKQRYKMAAETLEKHYTEVLLLENTSEKATYLNNLGYYQSKLKYPASLNHMMFALKIRKSINDLIGLFSSYNYLTLYFQDKKNKKEALKYSAKAIKIANQIDSPSFQLKALELKLSLHDNTEFQDYLSLNTSLLNEKQLEDNKYAAIKYDVEKERQKADDIQLKLKTSEVEKLKERSTRIMFQGIGLLLIASSIFLYVIVKSKHKKDKIQQVYQTERQLSKKVHDELANDMSDLLNFVENNVTNTTHKPLLLDNIEDIYLRTRDISTQTGSIDLINFQASIKHLLMQHNKPNTKVLIHNIDIINWQKVSDHKKVILYRCLQELMVNMKKHSKAKTVSIAFKDLNHKKEIIYFDNGIGFIKDVIIPNGLLNVESRIKAIGGSFNFKTSKGKGVKASIRFTP